MHLQKVVYEAVDALLRMNNHAADGIRSALK